MAAPGYGAGTGQGGGADNGANFLANNTIDANKGSGIYWAAARSMLYWGVCNNFITNHTSASTYGQNVATGSVSANALFQGFFDYNWYYGNTTDFLNLTYSAHDTHGTNPNYVAQSTEGYTPGSVAYNSGFPVAAFPQAISGNAASHTYWTMGAVQLQNQS